MDTPWHIDLLGRLRASQGDRVVTRFRAQKGGALLAYLAYHLDRPHPREELIELLWPTSEPSHGRNSLSRELSSLRCQLEPPGVPSGAVIVADRACVRLNPAACTTDVLQFEAALKAAAQAGAAAGPRLWSPAKEVDSCSPHNPPSTGAAERVRCLTQAVDRYGGELLPGYFESWISPERQRLADAYLHVLEELLAHHEQAGNLHAALQFAWRAVAADALREESQYHLIRLLVLNGQPAAALQQYRELERLLASELGVQPAPELQSLAGELQRRAEATAPRQVADQPHRETRRGPAAASSEAPAVHVTPEVAPASARTQILPSSASADPEGPEIHLPIEFTRFFGREGELDRLQALLGETGDGRRKTEDGTGDGLSSPDRVPAQRADLPTTACRLVTLTGPGGSGKTRLALQAARRIAELDQRSVWFVPLADLSDARLLGDKIAVSLGLPRSPEVPPMEQVVAFLSHRTASARASAAAAGPLLVLDNFEHLVSEGAGLVRELLERILSLTCLVTSRQPLELTGEQEFPVAPLPVPVEGLRRTIDAPPKPDPSDPSNPSDLSALLQCPSVALFVDRAQAVRPDFQVTRTNAPAVAALCARLEGLPLALELAAARVGVLTPAQMLRHLEQRFDFLVSRKRDATPRHRSLRAALDWSYQLLSPELQRFFARLSVFQGGWTLEAAEAVCNEPEVLTYLEQLRECSLVQSAEVGGEVRFRLLETLREYGAEQLGVEERTDVAHRHASYFLALAERGEPELTKADQVAWLDRLERDQDNVRAALSWLEASGRIQEALRLGGALRGFWTMRGDPAEGLARLRGLLALPDAAVRTSARAKALNSAGDLAGALGENETALSLHEESLTIARQRGDRWNIALALSCMGARLISLGHQKAARSRFEEALKIWQEIGDPWGIACTLTGLGRASADQRDNGETSAVLKECLALRRQLGDQWGVAFVLCLLGSLARDAGDHGEARSLLQEALAVAQEVGNRSLICRSLMGLGHLAYLEGDLPAARALLEQGLPLAREVGVKRTMGEFLIHLADSAGDQGDLAMASACVEEALAIWRLTDDRTHLAWALRIQGRIALRRADLVTAGQCFAERLAMRRTSSATHEIAQSLEDMAELAHMRRDEERAARLLGAAAALLEGTGTPRPPIECTEFDRRLDAVRSTLGEAGFAAAWLAGRAMSAQQAIAEALLEAPAG